MKKLKRAFQKIENDYQEFKDSMLSENTEVVFENAYKIFCVNEIYYVLTNSYEYSRTDIHTVLNFKGNILEQIYDEWLHTDYSHQDLFDDTITKTLNLLKVERNK